jgi:deazaflavin-dependent oxidoreductase (nitroreductase family)
MNDPKEFNRGIIEEFRANAGKVGGMFEGAPLLLLTARGAKTGRVITSPVAYHRDGDRYVVVASKGGAPSNPAWYHNLRANPEATIEVGTQTIPVRATVPERAERDRLFNAIVERMPQFGEYQRNTTRIIPVVVLERAGDHTDAPKPV